MQITLLNSVHDAFPSKTLCFLRCRRGNTNQRTYTFRTPSGFLISGNSITLNFFSKLESRKLNLTSLLFNYNSIGIIRGSIFHLLGVHLNFSFLFISSNPSYLNGFSHYLYLDNCYK
jgi:hypothetical protein